MVIGVDIRTLMDARYSGVSEYTLNLVSALLMLDRENEYRLFYNSARDLSGRMPKFDYPNVKIVKKSVPNKILNYFLFKFLNSPKIDKLLDVDPASGRGASVFFMPHINFIALSGKSKSVLTIHDLSFLRYPEFFSARKNFWHKMINVKRLAHKFDKIIAVSENTKRDVVELCGVNPDRVKVIYSGIEDIYKPDYGLRITDYGFDIIRNKSHTFWGGLLNPVPKIDFVDPTAEQVGYSKKVRDKYNLPDKFTPHLLNTDIRLQGEKQNKFLEGDMKFRPKGAGFILFLGTVEPRKNIIGLIRAYEILKERNSDLSQYKLVIAGGNGWRSEGIYKVWRESKYKDDIIFLGYIEKKDKVYLYNLASLFVYPSFYEGFGFPPLEAMASGVPVITSFSSSLPEIVGGAGLMVDPYNINDLAIAMEKVLTDDDLRDNLIKKGLERVKKFSWEKAGREYLSLFKNSV